MEVGAHLRVPAVEAGWKQIALHIGCSGGGGNWSGAAVRLTLTTQAYDITRDSPARVTREADLVAEEAACPIRAGRQLGCA